MRKASMRLAAWMISLVGFTQAVMAERNLTFFVWSDTHYGAYDYADPTRLETIDDMNNMVNVRYPSSVRMRYVDKPAFLMHLGDVTEQGKASQWNSPDLADHRSYIQTINHLDPAIRTYEIMGNHDGLTNDIRTAITQKHGNTYYSFNEQGVHIVVLDPYKKASVKYPDLDDEQLTWLSNDLNSLPPQTPIIMTIHIFPDDYTGDRTSHLGSASSKKLAGVLQGKNVLAILHGHYHCGGKTTWNGIDVLATGFCYMRSGCPNGSPTFQVIKITDDRMYALEYDWNANAWAGVLVNKFIVDAVRGDKVTIAEGRGADAFTYQKDPNGNYGNWVKVQTLSDFTWGYHQTGYLRFDLSGLLGPYEEFATATLWLCADDGSQNAGYQKLGVYGLDDGCDADLDGGWDEGTITWNNQPETVGTLLDSIEVFGGVAPGWHAFANTKLLDFLNADRNGLVTIRLKRIDDKGSSMRFYSKDNNDLIPYLEYTTRLKNPSAFVPGDANIDGKVDVGDLGILAGNYGTLEGATWAKGDFNSDGKVDVGDLGILAANYGTGVSGADWDADYAKAFGETVAEEKSKTDEDTPAGTLCSGLGLPLVAGLILAGLMLTANSRVRE